MVEDPPHSVHGGRLPFDERWMRRKSRVALFGEDGALCLGRYQIGERLGAGGMGTVYSAWDPELERKIAIKVLHHRDSDAATRLRQEARALAALAHPNVVTVFEVAHASSEVFLVMEHVEGSTLRVWQGEEGRRVGEVLGAYHQAGLGLAAAHRADLVHGDFKPDNVLVHSDGRVRVADFGLCGRGPTSGSDSEDHGQTRGGGTAAYMAPELQQDGRADARSDQFAFCVSLREGLRTAVGRVPRRVHRAVERGLSPDPDARFPSLEDLLPAIESRRRWWIGPTVGLAAAGILLAIGSRDPCSESASRVWSEDRARVQTKFEAAEPRWVSSTWRGVDQALQAQENALVLAGDDACRAAEHRTEVLSERAQTCLETASLELGGFIQRLLESDASVLATAALRVSLLTPPERCRNEATLEHLEARSDPKRHQRLVDAAVSFARLPGVPIRADEAELRAGIESGGMTESLALRVRAQSAISEGRPSDAVADLKRSVAISERQGDDTARVHGLALLAFAIGQDTQRLREAEQVGVQALSALDAMSPRPILRARLLHDLGSVAAHARPPSLEDAIARHEDAVATLEQHVGPEHPLTLRARLSLGSALSLAGRHAEAVSLLESTDAAVQGVWERHEPTWSRARRALGLAHLAARNYEESLRVLTDARAANRDRGATPLERAYDHYNLALVQRRLDRPADAYAELERGYPIAREALGAEHPELTPWLALLGRTALKLGRDAEAARWFERALYLCELDGAEPKEFAKLRLNLAEALLGSDAETARVHADGARRFLAQQPAGTFEKLRARLQALTEALVTDRAQQGSEVPPRSR